MYCGWREQGGFCGGTMSEKIYALLLRVYPEHFRRMYGEEALQLVHDRMRDERGLWAKVRLWWDLLADFARSAPREYGHLSAELAGAAAGQRADGVPSFLILEDEPMRVGNVGGGRAFCRCRWWDYLPP